MQDSNLLQESVTKSKRTITSNNKLKGVSLKSNLSLLSMCTPGLILTIIFAYLPMYGVILAFKDYKIKDGILGSKWVGFKNFDFFLTSDIVWRVTRNTVFMNLLFIVSGIIISVIFAFLLYELNSKITIKFYQTAMFLPNFLSWVVITFIAYAFLNLNYGIVNNFIAMFGFEKIDWYSDPQYWPTILMILNIWKGAGFGSLIYYAALTGLNVEYFEAAEIDGATRLQTIFYIMVPALIPLITMMFLFGIGGIIRADFGLFYQVPRDIPLLYPTTDVLDTYVYRTLKQSGSVTMSAAVGFYQSLVGTILVITTNKIVRKYNPDGVIY